MPGEPGEGTPMDGHDTFQELLAQLPDELRTSIDHVAKLGAQGMLTAALQAEVDEYLARHRYPSFPPAANPPCANVT